MRIGMFLEIVEQARSMTAVQRDAERSWESRAR
jgi:hypothetical protein